MQSTDIPSKFVEAFAKTATGTYKRAIPKTSADPVAASLDLGFPPGTFGPTGTPPDGRDFNGLLYQVTAWLWYFASGGTVPFDSAFSTAVGGYPKFCVLPSATPGTFWQSIVENNDNDPDVTPTGWLQLVPALATSGAGWRKSADGFIEQWGVVAIASGVTSYTTSFSFPIPFTTQVNGPWGNANNLATPSGWSPVTVVFPGTSLSGSSVNADTANNSKTFQSGVYVRWFANGY